MNGRRCVACAAWGAVLVFSVTSVSGVHADDPNKKITGVIAAAVRAWVEAVQAHDPGHADGAVTAVAAYSYATREQLNTGLSLFVRGLFDVVAEPRDKTPAPTNPAAREIWTIAHAAGTPNPAIFLKRAALLHADVARYDDETRLQPTPMTSAAPGPSQRSMAPSRNQPVAPLLFNERLPADEDGELLGEVPASWHWPFARFLLDLKDRGAVPLDDPFIPAWYHATIAYMLGKGTYGDLERHLKRAAERFPEDARILFDRACYAEMWGLPLQQALLTDRERIEQQHHDSQSLRSYVPGTRWTLSIPYAEKTNAEAEDLFRHVLTVDPALVEARVRLARLLEGRGRHAEAAAALKIALDAHPSGVVGYYAHLFAGRVAQALGQIDEAAAQYKDARTLFPNAQSALIASSQLALLGAHLPDALAPLERLGPKSAEDDADPWWRYDLGPGRDADVLWQALGPRDKF